MRISGHRMMMMMAAAPPAAAAKTFSKTALEVIRWLTTDAFTCRQPTRYNSYRDSWLVDLMVVWSLL